MHHFLENKILLPFSLAPYVHFRSEGLLRSLKWPLCLPEGSMWHSPIWHSSCQPPELRWGLSHSSTIQDYGTSPSSLLLPAISPPVADVGVGNTLRAKNLLLAVWQRFRSFSNIRILVTPASEWSLQSPLSFPPLLALSKLANPPQLDFLPFLGVPSCQTQIVHLAFHLTPFEEIFGGLSLFNKEERWFMLSLIGWASVPCWRALGLWTWKH